MAVPRREELVVVRCTGGCGGLVEVTMRSVRRTTRHRCFDCAHGKIVTVQEFHEFWTSRFTAEELREMGKAIWG